MKRFLIFTGLFPFLALLVFLIPGLSARPELPAFRVLYGMLEIAYFVAIVPAWFSASIDWYLSDRPTFISLAITAASGIIVSLGSAYVFGLRAEVRNDPVVIGLVGAIPATVCSWLSKTNRMKQDA
ncbi:hypothetical protein [Bradyrhizobium cajani]|uniref:Uncharacterized protein n=1 Tax=Bradyrhizobium cajani TaxID=1928661 RepID=A0A844T0F3_9BRAD|nr:hypothetical protein [Bradyrhizobium cajani]MCP3371677.1 hypothetical protein [Bradyrhizobium cajani]MVT72643.1 hypothetical protein [Bradyrhizobium cajani]